MMKSGTLFECGPLPPYIHLASTGRHSHDRCFQAFPVFHALPLPYYTERKPKTKNGGGLRTYSSPNRKCVSETKGRI